MKKPNGQSGVAIVEFSLVFILFMVLSLGLFELGRAMWIYTTLSHAARQGARFAMVRGDETTALGIEFGSAITTATNAEITQVVRNHAIGLVATDITVTPAWKQLATDAEVDWDAAGIQRIGGTFVVVRVAYPMRFITGNVFIGGSDGGLTLGSLSHMTISYRCPGGSLDERTEDKQRLLKGPPDPGAP